MSDGSLPARASLVKLLVDLANQIDGVADFGLLVAYMDETTHAGRNQYIEQCCEKIQGLVESIVSCLKQIGKLDAEQLSTLQSELVQGATLLSSNYLSLKSFRNHRPEAIRPETAAIRQGWEQLHRSIRQIAEKIGILDPSWYDPILERQPHYRDNLAKVLPAFHETVIPSASP